MPRIADIQKEILRRLTGAQILRYRDLHPHGVESDLYNYHLQQLVRKGYVRRLPEGYSLSLKGQRRVGETEPINLEGDSEDLFKINVVTLIVRVYSGRKQVLLQRRARHPGYGLTTIPGGAMRKGELWRDASVRTIERECGITPLGPQLCGMVRTCRYEGDIIMSDALYHICLTRKYAGTLIEETVYGHNSWHDLESAIALIRQTPDTLSEPADILDDLTVTESYGRSFFYIEHADPPEGMV